MAEEPTKDYSQGFLKSMSIEGMIKHLVSRSITGDIPPTTIREGSAIQRAPIKTSSGRVITPPPSRSLPVRTSLPAEYNEYDHYADPDQSELDFLGEGSGERNRRRDNLREYAALKEQTKQAVFNEAQEVSDVREIVDALIEYGFAKHISDGISRTHLRWTADYISDGTWIAHRDYFDADWSEYAIERAYSRTAPSSSFTHCESELRRLDERDEKFELQVEYISPVCRADIPSHSECVSLITTCGEIIPVNAYKLLCLCDGIADESGIRIYGYDSIVNSDSPANDETLLFRDDSMYPPQFVAALEPFDVSELEREGVIDF